MIDCVFCKIISGEIPSNKVYEDDQILAFRDLNPVAPTHILVIPKKHIDGAADITEEDAPLIGHIFVKIAEIAKAQNLPGFRVVTNCGKSAGQSVFHLHYHLIGGRELALTMV